jgi:hypothetical protein
VLWVEPDRHGLTAWRWNLLHVETARDVKVRWRP